MCNVSMLTDIKDISVSPQFLVCIKCGVEKHISEFNKHRTKKYGVVSTCKECVDFRVNSVEKKLENSIKNKKSRRDYPAKWILYRVKSRCKKLNIPFSLLEKDVYVPEKCPVLGIKLMIGDSVISDNSPSLDRIDPKLGYVVGNIRVISNKANRIKSNATAQELDKVIYYLERNLKLISDNRVSIK